MTGNASDCPRCDASGDRPFFVLRKVPAFCNVLWDTPETARLAPAGDIELVHCPACGLIFNRAFDPRLVDYAPGYENPLHHSARFRDFADGLSRRLVAEHRLQGGLAVEIGCGDADFLHRLTAAGMGRGIGFDPSLGADARFAEQRVELFAEPFGARPLPAGADLVLCRHVLEHIPRPGEWLRNIRRDLDGHEAVFYCEVPNMQWLLDSCSLWDVIYEHVTYWTPESIRRLFRDAGFDVLSVTTGFDGQFLMLEAATQPAGDADAGHRPAADPETGRAACGSFARTARDRLARWRRRLAASAAASQTAVAWGAGSKGVTFANLMGAGTKLAGLVDINPGKQGRFVPGAALPVLAPEQLPAIAPAVVFVMNVNYLDEIRSRLADLGLTPELLPVADAFEATDEASSIC